MKTEKRLTMALSVLVALMMLAVPLASSSNLFVDGGQTNSNGDAPSLGASTGYTITFQLNADGKSLDQTNVNDTFIGKLKAATNENGSVLKDKVTWYINENDDLCALVIGNDVPIQNIIKLLFTGETKITKSGYTLMSWKDATTGALFDSSVTGVDYVKKDMTFAAQWELQTDYVEVPVTVNFDGDVKEYYKAYKATDGKIPVNDINASNLPAAVEKVGKLSIEGYVVNNTYGAAPDETHITNVYSEGKVTYGDSKELPADGKTIPSTSKLTVTYTFNSAQYSKITVHSIAFKDGKDVVLYADKAKPYDYNMIFKSLGKDGVKAIDAEPVDKSVNYKTTDGKYLLTGWNNNEALLNAEINTTLTEFTLDAKLNGYNIVFMVNGQYEVKFVEFGKLSEDLCTLGTSGLNHWVWIPFNDVAAGKLGDNDPGMTGLEGIDLNANPAPNGTALFQTFSFASQSNIDTVEKVAAVVDSAEIPSVVFIACFESPANTAYAIFDANSGKITGYFGDNESIDRIVIPGKISSENNNTPITTSSVTPKYDENMIFIGWNVVGDVDSKNYGKAEGNVTAFSANVKPYDHILSFYVDGEISAKLYYTGTLAVEKITLNQLVAFEYEGMIYAANVDNFDKAAKALQPEKDGYTFTQWNDKDGKKVFSVSIDKTTKDINIETGDGYPKDGVKTDMDFYAQFDAKSYTIKYVNAFGGEQTQKVKVDQNVTLYGKGTFIQEGYELAGWSTVPGAGGDEYKLEGTFVLNGADYEKLASASSDGKTVVIELYSIWEFGGVTPGDNTEGSDNTALYLIAGMLLVIAVLGIAALFLLRRKN